MRSVRLPQTLRRTKRPTSTTRHESETVLTLVSFSRREEEEKNLLSTKNCQLFFFFVFFSWSRVARWKEKLTVPLSVPSPLVVLRRAQLTDFYMFPLGTMCEKREGKGSYRWGRICEMLQCDIGGFSPSSVQVVFFPPSLVVSQLIPRRVSGESTGVFVAGQRMGSGRQESGLRGADREGGVRG